VRIIERDLEFDFTGALSAFKFDDQTTHASSSIQAVDFIIEYADRYQFIEVKDPDEPGAADVNAFTVKLRSGKLIRSLAGKYRDSLFFRGFEGKENKEIEYIVLLSMSVLDDALLLAKQDELHRSIPFSHERWEKNSASACVILNIRKWKERYGSASVRRLSEVAHDHGDASPAEEA
jgi:hypothetical protein